MTRTNRLYAPTRALPAIAAALALSSTQALAQEAQPATTEPGPATTVQPAPAPTEAAPTTDSGATAPVSDTSTQAPTPTAKPTAKRTVRTTRTTAARPAPARTRVATRTVAPRAAAPAAGPAAPPARTAAATPVPTAAATPAPPPPVTSKPVPAKPATTSPINLTGDTLPIAGGALALLALGGAAVAITGRRRRRREQEWADEQTLAYEPFETMAAAPEPEPEPAVNQEQPAMAAPSAFAWGNQAQADEIARPAESRAEHDDRRPGETWVERARRGPTPNNPSVSLRNRLSRAAFFDKRERESAAGLAEPVDANAGLPEAMAERPERAPA